MKSAEQWLEELGINTGEKVCIEIEDVQRIQRDAAALGEAMAKAWEADADDVPELMDAAVKEWRMAYPPTDQAQRRGHAAADAGKTPTM